MTKHKDFEDFLRDVHASGYEGTDDLMPDAYEDWLSNLDANDVINWANQYTLEVREKALEEAAKCAEMFGMAEDLKDLNGLDRNTAYLSGVMIAKNICSLKSRKECV